MIIAVQIGLKWNSTNFQLGISSHSLYDVYVRIHSKVPSRLIRLTVEASRAVLHWNTYSVKLVI